MRGGIRLIVSLLTDAPKYNLALMKLSAFHKAQGDTVYLNNPLVQADKTYASVLFSWNKDKFHADEYGGVQFPTVSLPRHIERLRPDYDLYGLEHSLGYTFRPCFRRCDFCLVKTIRHPDSRHHSIWTFHEKRFKKICLMNNNTFFDPEWKRTFQEIWDADLNVMEHGLDLRLLTQEKVDAIKKTKFDGRMHFAWDRMQDEKHIISGLNMLREAKIESRIYVLIGFNTDTKQDLHRCQIIVNLKHVPYVMPYNETTSVKDFKSFINGVANWWHMRDDITSCWKMYLRGERTAAKDLISGDLFDE
jgi:hypothetical protein